MQGVIRINFIASWRISLYTVLFLITLHFNKELQIGLQSLMIYSLFTAHGEEVLGYLCSGFTAVDIYVHVECSLKLVREIVSWRNAVRCPKSRIEN